MQIVLVLKLVKKKYPCTCGRGHNGQKFSCPTYLRSFTNFVIVMCMYVPYNPLWKTKTLYTLEVNIKSNGILRLKKTGLRPRLRRFLVVLIQSGA